MKKMLTAILALVSSTVMLSGAALSASAVTVVAESDEFLLFDTSGTIRRSELTKYMEEDVTLHAGDVVVRSDGTPGFFSMTELDGINSYVPDDSKNITIIRLGKAEDVYADSIKELTVTESMVEEGHAVHLELVDAEGNSYSWDSYAPMWRDLSVEAGYSPLDYQVGDTARFVLQLNVWKKEEVLYPVDPSPSYTAPQISTMKGDVNGNGTVDIMDVILLNRHIMIGAELSEQGRKNALTGAENNGAARAAAVREPDSVDSLNILKYIVGLIDEL